MRIVAQGKKPPKFDWMVHPWKCSVCGTIVRLDESDENKITYSLNTTTRGGLGKIRTECPVCKEHTNFFEVFDWEKQKRFAIPNVVIWDQSF